jgi:pimeloyl-ACP methyl ester carboxylesterase
VILLRLSLHQFDPREPQSGEQSKSAAKADLIFIHGTGSSAEMWTPQVELLTGLGYRCFVIDLRGHGQSHEPREHTDLSVHKADVLETIENSPIRFPAVFVGHSLGAILSLTLAEDRPELISLVFAAGFPGRLLKPITYVFKLFMEHGYDPLKAKNWHKGWAFRPRTLIETDKHSLEQIVANFGELDFITNLPKVKCKVHLAAGRFDPVAPSFYALEVHRALPTSTFKMFEWGGHNFMDTHPKTFNKWLVEGLQQAEQGQ